MDPPDPAVCGAGQAATSGGGGVENHAGALPRGAGRVPTCAGGRAGEATAPGAGTLPGGPNPARADGTLPCAGGSTCAGLAGEATAPRGLPSVGGSGTAGRAGQAEALQSACPGEVRAALAVGAPPARPAAGCTSEASTGCSADRGSAVQHEWSRPEGMDPNSCYLLQIKLIGNRKKIRKDMMCYSLEQIIDSDLTNDKDLVESIVEKNPPGYLEVAHVQYYDENLETYPEVKSDQDLMAMFQKHCTSKVVEMFIVYCDPSEPYEPISEWHSHVKRQANSNIEQDEDNYLCNPFAENEHVGVDEEVMYLDDAPVHVVACCTKEKDKDYYYDDESEDLSEMESGSEVEADEEILGHEGDHIPNVEYDKEDPPMSVGTSYPSMKEFKLVLSQHAMKHEFEYNTTKSAPHRFRAYCSRRDEDKCPWWLHASKVDDTGAIVVKKNPCAHECSSTRRQKKVKNGTKYWVCAKVKDWLIADATIGATELQKKMKEHYKVSIHYKRVYMGKELALKQLYGDWDSSFDNLFRFKA
ncbi:uncharacterized protein C2845_PM02G15230 [Panicum miliaceum]|uniref:Transposase MuDR plant domain-containing protein n=1 Tax=Panicum miliaceum TaxID=4540 RepID=A0A3L6SAK6_PANMI|nr:uncharacterized protein C2845_PM02G15230 [Panicum miliaceum]